MRTTEPEQPSQAMGGEVIADLCALRACLNAAEDLARTLEGKYPQMVKLTLSIARASRLVGDLVRLPH
jgi:hypothetical protein